MLRFRATVVEKHNLYGNLNVNDSCCVRPNAIVKTTIVEKRSDDKTTQWINVVFSNDDVVDGRILN